MVGGQERTLGTQATLTFHRFRVHTVVRDVKESLNQAVKDSGKSREQILDSVNELAHRHGLALSGKGGVSKDLLDKWLNVEDDSRVPGIKALSLLCAVLETSEPILPLVLPLGGMVINDEDVKLLEWARAYQASKALRKKMRKIEEELR